MDKMSIAFPNLGIYLKYVPKSFSIGGLTIAAYGLIIAFGVMVGFCVTNADTNRQGLGRDAGWDFAVPAVFFSVLGARIYYVLFSWDYYATHLGEILNIRKGGLAIYGGVIGGFLTLFVFCRIKKLRYFRMADSCVLGLVLGQVIGRWGNFTNREVFGEYTDNLFAMRLPVEMVRTSDLSEKIIAHMTDGAGYIQVHPTFLYESALNLILFTLLMLYRRHKAFDGEIALLYLGGYGLIRFFVEGIRTDQLLIPGTNLPVSQMLGIGLFTAAVVAELIVRLRLARSRG